LAGGGCRSHASAFRSARLVLGWPITGQDEMSCVYLEVTYLFFSSKVHLCCHFGEL
jgi:hypothetical protein